MYKFQFLRSWISFVPIRLWRISHLIRSSLFFFSYVYLGIITFSRNGFPAFPEKSISNDWHCVITVLFLSSNKSITYARLILMICLLIIIKIEFFFSFFFSSLHLRATDWILLFLSWENDLDCIFSSSFFLFSLFP